MKTFACPTCDVGALGATVTAFSANYSVTLFGRTVNAGEIFYPDFLANRTAQSVQRLAQYIDAGIAVIGADGSMTVNNFKVAPAGSLNVGRINQLKPSLAAVSAALGTSSTTAATSIPINQASAANRASEVVAAVMAGTRPATPTVSNPPERPSLTQTLISGALSIFQTREETRAINAATRSSVLNPPTAPAQGAAVNSSAAYGPGADLGGGPVRAGTVFDESGRAMPSGPLVSVPQLPTLPPAPPPVSLSLPVTGAVIQPATLQSISPSTGLPTPVFPGIPPSTETGNGSVQLNAASLANLMDETARATVPAPARPFWSSPAFLGAVAVAAGAFLYFNRRRRR